ncbi:MAG: Mn2+/Fe2+ transporter [Acidimicrobiales bacterium]|nr:Mn2+/Fe2+ transporter [Acidimicrobiales bacterium]
MHDRKRLGRGRPDLDIAPAAVHDAPIGDITGALGSISMHDREPRRTWRHRLVTLAAVAGPGLIVMVGDNDAGGVATYTQAGQNYGYSLLWVLFLLVPVLVVAQEMVVRLGAVTGVGQARLIRERFGRRWGWCSVADLLVVNFLTIVTELIGVRLGTSYFGIRPSYSVPVAAAALMLLTATGSFRRWERVMFVCLAVSFAFVPLLFMTHPHHVHAIVHGALVPGVQGGVTDDAVLVIVAMVGTTVAPWQLFFQQSNIVDKRISPRWIRYERIDTVAGAVLSSVAAGAYVVFAFAALGGSSYAGRFTDSGAFQDALRRTVGTWAGGLASIILINAAIIGACAVTLSSSYALGDTFGIKHSLHRRPVDPKVFAGYAIPIVLAAVVVLIPGVPLGTITQYVQILGGLLLPSALLFLLLLCNDREVLGPWCNARWQNALTTGIVGALCVTSLVLVVRTLVVTTAVAQLVGAMFGAYALVLVVAGAVTMSRRRRRVAAGGHADVLHGIRYLDRATWRMAPLDQLAPRVMTRSHTIGLCAVRGYLLVAVGLVTLKVTTSIID